MRHAVGADRRRVAPSGRKPSGGRQRAVAVGGDRPWSRLSGVHADGLRVTALRRIGLAAQAWPAYSAFIETQTPTEFIMTTPQTSTPFSFLSTFSLFSFFGAATMTIAMLAGVSGLATGGAANAQMAHAAASQAKA